MARGDDDAEVFAACYVCSGAKNCPRNGRGGATCSASSCKAQHAARKGQQVAEVQPQLFAHQIVAEELPSDMQVHELTEILGERCCRPAKLSQKRRRSGPRSSAVQEYLVRGTFIESNPEDGDESGDEDVPEANTYWVTQDDLLESISARDVRSALADRQQQVLQPLEDLCTAESKRHRRK